jgi:broad specificity phosphatase PhoE
MSFDKSITPALCAIVFLVLVLIAPAGLAAEGDTLVFLIRHAEKIDESRDPGLSEAGLQRSRELARVLHDADIQHIHSTNFIRTRDTVAPLANLLGLEVEIYDWDDPAKFAGSLVQRGQRHLVVGHSNTTTKLVALLGGNPGTEIEHSNEHDRLYILNIDSDGNVTSLLIRYGAPFSR